MKRTYQPKKDREIKFMVLEKECKPKVEEMF